MEKLGNDQLLVIKVVLHIFLIYLKQFELSDDWLFHYQIAKKFGKWKSMWLEIFSRFIEISWFLG